MDVETAIVTRRAVKQFDPDYRITNAETEKMISLAMPLISSIGDLS